MTAPAIGDEMMGLLELAERCEKAEHGSYALDDEIARALGWTEYSEECDNDYVDEGWHSPDGRTHAWHPFWTRSLDAAMTLIVGPAEYPDSKTFLLDCATQTSQFTQPVAYVWNDTGKHMGKGRTPALAFCAAALRARAAQGDQP